MSTDDCTTVGHGPCPCGKGEISVEFCMPDHPWASVEQGDYRPSMTCVECASKYEFFDTYHNKKPRLVLRTDATIRRDAEAAWHKTLKDIEANATFGAMVKKLELTLAEQKSAAAAHRLLIAAKMSPGSISQYRKYGYKLSSLHAREAATLLNVQDSDLEALMQLEEKYAEARRVTPPAVKTGNAGLEA